MNGGTRTERRERTEYVAPVRSEGCAAPSVDGPRTEQWPQGTPGSVEAVSAGCWCAIQDNAYGAGYLGGIQDEDGKTLYVVNYECPIHGGKDARGEGVVSA